MNDGNNLPILLGLLNNLNATIVERGNRNNRNQCKHCDQSFYYKSALQNHERKTHYDKCKFHCEICKLGYGSKGGLMSHRSKLHLDSFKHKCDVCRKGFLTAKGYQKHVDRDKCKVDKNNVNIACPKCGEKFRKLGQMIAHVVGVHIKKYVDWRTGLVYTNIEHYYSDTNENKQNKISTIITMDLKTNNIIKKYYKTGVLLCTSIYSLDEGLIDRIRYDSNKHILYRMKLINDNYFSEHRRYYKDGRLKKKYFKLNDHKIEDKIHYCKNGMVNYIISHPRLDNFMEYYNKFKEVIDEMLDERMEYLKDNYGDKWYYLLSKKN